MFNDEIGNPKPLSKRAVRRLTLTVLACSVYMLAASMMAANPVHESDCAADTLTCAQEVSQ